MLFPCLHVGLTVAQPPSNYFTITGAPSTATAGQSINGITVTAYNSNGQVLTSYTGQVYFTSTDSRATLPYTSQSTYTFTTGVSGDNGVHVFSGINLVTAGSQTITVTDGTMSGTSPTIIVSPAALYQIQVSPKTATIVTGSQITYTATASDYYGNTWDVSASTFFYIDSGAHGSWSNNVYTSASTGVWGVGAFYNGKTDSASLTVIQGNAVSITISPKTPSITAGNSQSFTATAHDSMSNEWDVTSLTTWSIDSGAGGSWSANTYTSHIAGTWLVTGTYGSFHDTASLTVTHSTPSYLSISPVNPTSAAGTSVTFTATAFDFYGNSWDVTSLASFSITSGAGGSWSGNVYTSAKAGIWTVSASYLGIPATTTLTISFANVNSITITPQTSTLVAGSSEAFTATALDIYGNTLDVSSSTSWSINVAAEGSWTGNTYTSAIAGIWTVTGLYEGISETATLTVTPGSAISLVVGSAVSSTAAGTSVTFTATAFDSFGNSWDVSASTSWVIDSGAQGHWSGNVYTSAKAGFWTVTGVYGVLRDSATLTVTPGQPISLTISPPTADLTAGLTQTYTATAQDSFSNTWDVSSLARWTINSQAGGLWSGNVYSSAIAGSWTVTATYQGLSNTASLTVTHTYAVQIQVNPETSTIVAGNTQTYTTTATDHFGNSWDTTSSSTFTVDEEAGGSLNGNIYTSANAGTWTVTATSLGLTNTAMLTITHASAVSISISPNTATITAGSTQTYTALASDTYNNIWDVTSLTTWTVSTGAGGSWSGNVYTSAASGNWVIKGTYSSFSDTAYLTVNHANAISVSIMPKTATITTGSNEAFTATAIDAHGNIWDVTSASTWIIDSGAGGSWTGNVYYSVDAGTWRVTVTYGSLTDTASLTVNHGTAQSITVTPTTATLTAGSPQTFTATAYDSNGNRWDVTSSTTWTIDSGAGGLWSGSTYTSNTAGVWIVVGTYSGLTSTSTVTVNHAPAASITVGSSSNSITAGATVTFTATASDVYGNLWSVTSSTVWTIDSGAGGSLSGNSYTSELSGVWTVKGAYGSLSDILSLTVTHASMVSINVTPTDATVAAGSNEAYSVTAYDSFGNSWDITSSAQLSISSQAGGIWTNNVYTPAKAGTWTITAAVPGFSITTPIIVVHGSIASVTISPHNPTINAGSSQTFTATAYDQYGNSWDVSNLAIWIIDSGAQGSWANSVYTSDKAGTWEVTGVYDNLLDNTFMTVNHGTITSLTITPATATINQGSTQTYTSTASDAYSNTWDATSSTNWQITAGAGGSWTGNVYTSANTGTWTVTGTSSSVSGNAQLTVNGYSPVDFLHTGQVNSLDIFYFIYWYVYYGQYGYVNPACDFNHDGKLNFQDVVLFTTYYIAATTP